MVRRELSGGVEPPTLTDTPSVRVLIPADFERRRPRGIKFTCVCPSVSRRHRQNGEASGLVPEVLHTDLAGRGLDVHTYGVPDTTPPKLDGIRLHAVDADEIAATWFVVYDGGGDDAQKTALIAEGRDDSVFYGAWTYDLGIVDAAVDYLERAYSPDGAAHENLRSET